MVRIALLSAFFFVILLNCSTGCAPQQEPVAPAFCPAPTPFPLSCDEPIEIKGSIGISSHTQAMSLCASGCPLRITGGLTFKEASTSILGAVSCIQHIGGDLTLRHHNNIKVIEGFQNLESIGGRLWIQSNQSLAVLNAFPVLKHVGGSIEISRNTKLSTIIDFPALEYIGGRLLIESNHRLKIIDAFRHTKYTGSIYIWYNHALNSIEILEDGHKVLGDITLESLPQLIRIQSFNGIEEIQGNITISNLDEIDPYKKTRLTTILNTLRAFNNLRHLSGNIDIDLPATDISIFNNLKDVDGSIMIKWSNSPPHEYHAFDSLESVSSNFTYPFISSSKTHDLLPNLKRVDGKLKLTRKFSTPQVSLSSKLSPRGLTIQTKSLESLDIFHTIHSIRGPLDIRLNPTVPVEDVQKMVDAIGPHNIGGKVIMN